MQYKIKVRPEDFVVKEVTALPLNKKGEYGIYLLKKKGWNTVDLLKKISKNLHIPFSHISYGGKKDRHALTEQFISIKNPSRKISIEEKNYSLKFINFSSEPMDPRYIIGNEFEIIVRAIPQEAKEWIISQIEKIKKYGFVNYFDDQRFGSYDQNQGFIGEKLLKAHYNGALKIYLTHIYPEDKGEAKRRKRQIFEKWGNWEECLRLAKTNMERFSFTHLLKNPKDYITVLKRIPKEEMSMFFACYQSFLWNETLRRLLLQILTEEEILKHRGIAGDYIFYNTLDEKKFKYLKKLSLPTPSSKAVMLDGMTQSIYEALLIERQIKPSMFNLRKIRQAFFKSVNREVIVIPKDFQFHLCDDEIYKDKIKLYLKFFLSRGSYATMLIKRIFAKK